MIQGTILLVVSANFSALLCHFKGRTEEGGEESTSESRDSCFRGTRRKHAAAVR